MSNKIRIIPSGFDFVDKSWGGIYRGGSYLIVGPRKSGRTLMGLRFALEAAQDGEVTLYFTNMRPKDLMIQAASLNFDIQAYMNQNKIIVVRVGDPEDVYNLPNPDKYLADYFTDIISVVNQYKPMRLVFDELTPYVGFRNIQYLKDAFLSTLENIEEKDITSLFIIGEAATEKAEMLVNTIGQHVTGVFSLKKATTKFNNKLFGGTLEIIPNVGHTEGQFEFNYRIEPLKGVTIVDDEEENDVIPHIASVPVIKKSTKPVLKNTDNEKKNDNTVITYSYSDFKLILNNQIALYKSTGQMFNLVVFKLDSTIYQNGLFTNAQFKHTISQSMEKKDKLCFNEDYFYVLQVRSDRDSFNKLISRFVNNLPKQESDYLQVICDHVWLNNKFVDDKVISAESLLLEIVSDNDNFSPINSYLR